MRITAFLVEYQVLPGDTAAIEKNIKTMLKSLI
jgi:hypothetical protein